MEDEFEIVWTEFAERQLDLIFDFFLLKAGESVARKIVLSLIRSAEILKSHPKTGAIEPVLASMQEEFRYLVEGNYKLLYFLREKSVIIIDVFDTRRNPRLIKRGANG